MSYTFSDDYRYKKLTLRCIKNIHGLQIPISDNIFSNTAADTADTGIARYKIIPSNRDS